MIFMDDISLPLASAGGVLETVYSNIPWDIILVSYVFIFIDLFYGLIISCIKKEVISHKMLKGLHNKIFVLFVPIIGIVFKAFFIICSLPAEWAGSSTITSMFGVSQLSEFPICFLLCSFVLLMEFISFLENSAKIDPRANKIICFIQHKASKMDKIDDKDIKNLVSK